MYFNKCWKLCDRKIDKNMHFNRPPPKGIRVDMTQLFQRGFKMLTDERIDAEGIGSSSVSRRAKKDVNCSNKSTASTA